MRGEGALRRNTRVKCLQWGMKDWAVELLSLSSPPPLPLQAGRRQSLQPKQVTLVLPPAAGGGAHKQADVVALVSAGDDATADRSGSGSGSGSTASSSSDLLELAWEIAGEGGVPLALPAMAQLLFNAQDGRSLYITHRMLAADRVFFKQVCSTGPLCTLSCSPSLPAAQQSAR